MISTISTQIFWVSSEQRWRRRGAALQWQRSVTLLLFRGASTRQGTVSEGSTVFYC